MNCRDLERNLIEDGSSSGSLLSLEAEQHLLTCSRCDKLMRALRTESSEERPAPAVMSRLASDLAADLVPTRPLASKGFYLSVFAGTFASIIAFGVYREGTFALSAMSPVQTVTILCSLAVCAFLLGWSLVNQMAPGSRHWFRPQFLPAAVIVALSLLMAIFFRFGQHTLFWRQGWACLRTGFPFVLLAVVPFWLILRRGAILSPRAACAATGLLAGLAGTTVLEIHCPNLELSHILVWHLGVSLLATLGGFAVGTSYQFLRR